MPKKTDDCVKALMAKGKTEDEAWAICKSQFEDTISKTFADKVSLNIEDRTAVSVRDGVLEYYGAELGLEPAEAIFRVYRSPATIANAAYCMVGIPLTDEHVGLDSTAPNTGSYVKSAEVVDQVDELTASRLAVKNKLFVTDVMSETVKSRNQLSLGYSADLIPHNEYDFEQVNIIPHHLAAVENGRCGPLCCFLDRKPKIVTKKDESMKLNKVFLDAEGAVSLEQIVEIATGLPEAIKKVPLDKLQELMPAMQDIMSYSKEQGAIPEEESEMEDMDKEEEDMDKKEEDKAAFEDAVAKEAETKARKFADAEVKRYARVVNKAKHFLDDSYDFTDKTANQVMRDALATQGTEHFEDNELDVAFKLLRTSSKNYHQDAAGTEVNGIDARIEKLLAGEM